MSEYENWFSVRFPNIQATIDQSNDQESKLLKLACKEVWQHQQAEIDRLNSVLDERTKEWLQAIECGAYFENVAKLLKEENDRLKAQLNNMEACYIEKKKQVEELQGQLKTWKGQSLAAMLHGTCKCGEPWQSIVSDREGFNLLHCFNCNNDRYENKEFFGDHEPKSMRGASD